MSKNLFEETWKFALNEIKQDYLKQDKEAEFLFNFNMNYLNDDGNTITVSVASNFLQTTMLKKGSFDIVQSKIRELTGLENIVIKTEIINTSSTSVNVPESDEISLTETSQKSENYENEVEDPSKEIKISTLKKHPLLQEEFNFDTFIPGENSDYAYKASLAVAQNPGRKYNPILIYGGSGLGKTHLMQAIGNYIYNNDGEKLKIFYGSAESFANDFTKSLLSKRPNEFKEKYRNLDVLLLDDIHFLESKRGIQEELFYTFNSLHERHAQMVFTCDRPIKEVKNMADRLVSRLSNGLCIDITIPNYETRCAILQKKIEVMGKNLPSEIIDFIAKNVETNVRELESALNKVFGYEELTGESPTLDIAKSLLKDITGGAPEDISIDVIQKVIAKNYGITVSDLKSKKKDKKFALPRQIAMYIARIITEKTYTELGDDFGGKDHTTVMHAEEKIDGMLKVDQNLDAKIKILIKEIKEYKE